MIVVAILLVVLFIALTLFGLFNRWGTRWGATEEERGKSMTGDSYLEGGSAAHTSMTRAITINASKELVWPWLVQLGRGAGFYSFDRLDNGGKSSARHIVTWIPEPQLGDASAIGYLRHINHGQELVWWMSGERFICATVRMVTNILLKTQGKGTRLIIRISGDALGFTARLALWIFEFIDSIMARRQLRGIKERAERYGLRTTDPENPETGARDQYQFYEVIYASGETAGVKGKEKAAQWHKRAVEDGVIEKAN